MLPAGEKEEEEEGGVKERGEREITVKAESRHCRAKVDQEGREGGGLFPPRCNSMMVNLSSSPPPPLLANCKQVLCAPKEERRGEERKGGGETAFKLG